MGKIGFIGLGIMGMPMAKNLLKAGYELIVFNRTRAKEKVLVSMGAVSADSLQQLAKDCDIIITMLPNSPDVESVVLGDKGIEGNSRKGTLLIDMSSISPVATKKIADRLALKGIRMLDAPVSGGEPKAIDGTLAIMVGGTQEDFKEAGEIFNVLGASKTLVGPVGSGNTCKLANQVIVAANIAALSEGMKLAKMAGANPQKVFEAIKGGLAGSAVMNAKAPMMIEGNFKPGFKIDLHIKDLNNAIETGRQVESPMPITDMVNEMLKVLSKEGMGQSDHSALMEYYNKFC